MKKILYITTVSRTINAFLVPHIQMLIEEGYIVDCACCIDKEIDNNLIEKGVKVFNIPFTRNPLDARNLKAFVELIKIQNKNKYDIVHVHTPVASVYGRLLKIKFPKLKTIYTAHGFHFYKGAPKSKWFIFYNIEKFMSKFTDIIVTMNNEDYEVALNKFNAKKTLKVNGVGVNIDEYVYKDSCNDIRKELDLNEDDVVFTVIAELSKRKNQIQVIKAFDTLISEYNNIKLLLVGDGNLYSEYNTYIKNNNLDKHVKLLGYRTDIPKILSITDIVGLFSYHEGLPRNIMEAMVAKKPIVCTDIRGNNDLVKNNINGLLVPINNIKKTIQSIKKLYLDINMRNKMGEKGYEIIEKDYCINSVLQQIKQLYT